MMFSVETNKEEVQLIHQANELIEILLKENKVFQRVIDEFQYYSPKQISYEFFDLHKDIIELYYDVLFDDPKKIDVLIEYCKELIHINNQLIDNTTIIIKFII